MTHIFNKVSKIDKFNEVNEEQPKNIPVVFISREVSKYDKFNEVKDLQLNTIYIYNLKFDYEGNNIKL